MQVNKIKNTEKEEVQIFVQKETKEIEKLVKYIEEEGFRSGYLLCRKDSVSVPVKTEHIYYIEAMQEKQYVHTRKDIYKVNQKLYELERALPCFFMRVSKSVILNLHAVKEYKPLGGGLMLAEFENGDAAYLSRKYVKELRENQGGIVMKMKKRLSEKAERILVQGSVLGCVMFLVTVVYLGLQKDKAFALQMLPFLLPVLLGYVAFGMVFFFFYYRKERTGESGTLSSFMKGASGIYWIGNLFPLFLAAAALLGKKEPVRIILLLDALLVAGFLIWDYLYMNRCAGEFNRRFRPRQVFLADLEECPQSVEAFCIEIERYCLKNHRSLEFVKRDKPAEICMDGEHYFVELDSYYSQFGPMYSLKFIH